MRPEHLAPVPDAIDDVVAASLPVAYLTAKITLSLVEFKSGMTVLAPGIGGSVGNATYQLARAQGAGKVISTRDDVEALEHTGKSFAEMADDDLQVAVEHAAEDEADDVDRGFDVPAPAGP